MSGTQPVASSRMPEWVPAGIFSLAIGFVILGFDKESPWMILPAAMSVIATVSWFIIKREWRRSLAVLLVGLLLGGLGAVGYMRWDANRASSPDTLQPSRPSNPTGQPVKPTPASTDLITGTIDVPTEHAKIPLKGAVMSGRIFGTMPPGYQLWLVTYSFDNGGVYYVTGSIPVADGYWSMNTGQLGSVDSSEVGHLYRFELVLADAKTSATLSRVTPNGLKQRPDVDLLASRIVIRS